MYFNGLSRFVYAVLLTVLSHLSYATWTGTLFVFLFSTISSKKLLRAQVAFALFWLLNKKMSALPIPGAQCSQEFLFRILMAVICAATLLFSRKGIIFFQDKERTPLKEKLLPKAAGALYGFSALMSVLAMFRWFPATFWGWAFMCTLYARSLHKSDHCGPFKVAGKRLASLVVITLITAAMLELGIRLLPFDTGKSENIWMPHPQAIFTLRPGGRVIDKLEYEHGQHLEVERKISSQGIRDREYGPKTAEAYRIIALGDSFTMGAGLKLEDTVPKVLEKILNDVDDIGKKISVINCGVGGYAPWQELIFLNERGLNFSPDMVILQLFPANDVAGSYTKVGKYLHALNHKWEYKLRLFQNQNDFAFQLERWCLNHIKFYRMLVSFTGMDGLIEPILSNCRILPKKSYPPIISHAARDFQHEVCLVDWYPELQEAWNIYTESIREIRDTCVKHNVRLVAYVHGDKNSLKVDYWRELNKRFVATPYEKNKDIRLTQELLNDLGIPYINVMNCFLKVEAPQNLYFENDGHFSPYGAKILAESIRDFMVNENMLPTTEKSEK